MKIFWSWQSDSPGKIGRHFIRDALNAAIQTLKQPPEIEEPPDREFREALHLDQDRSGVPGSPDLAKLILEKIEKSSVLVADVTSVGFTLDGKKKLINPNVAIELGYGLHALTDRAFLMVLNEHYGSREDLPFDLRHKAGPILYRLAPDADKKTIDGERKRLSDNLVLALRPYLDKSKSSTTAISKFPEIPHKSNSAVYFDIGEHLAGVGEPGIDQINFSFATTNGIYLRLVPTERLPEPIKIAQLLQIAENSNFLAPLQQQYSQAFTRRNKYGVINCEPERGPHLKCCTQVFQNGEVWGFNANLLKMRTQEGTLYIPSLAVEATFVKTLHNYVRYFGEDLGIEPPYIVEAGIQGVEGANIAMPGQQLWGPIHQPSLIHRVILNDTTPSVCNNYLLDLFERIFDLSGYSRPNGFNNFPPPESFRP